MKQELLQVVFETADGVVHKERFEIKDNNTAVALSRAKKFIFNVYGDDTYICDWYIVY